MIGSELAGMGFAALAAVCYEGGYALQAIEARAVSSAQALRMSLVGRLLRRPRWLGGTVLSLVGYPLQVVALTLAPLALVQPVLALGLLLLLAFGALYLHERVGRRELAATLLVIAGVAAIAVAAPSSPEGVVRGTAFAIVLVLLAAATVLPWLLRLVRGELPAGPLMVAAGAGDSFAALAAAALAAELGHGRPAVALLWVLAAGAAAGAGFLCETTALQRLPATRVGPVVVVLQVVIPVIAGRVAGGEKWGAMAPLVWGGLVLVAGGVAVLAASPTIARLRA
jgi:drug/metabolite transporter (DMT)-like permease